MIELNKLEVGKTAFALVLVFVGGITLVNLAMILLLPVNAANRSIV